MAVTINKAMIDFPARFAGHVPVGPIPNGEGILDLSRTDWPWASGLGENVRRHGTWLRDEAEKRIGNLYPKLTITNEIANGRSDLQPLWDNRLRWLLGYGREQSSLLILLIHTSMCLSFPVSSCL